MGVWNLWFVPMGASSRRGTEMRNCSASPNMQSSVVKVENARSDYRLLLLYTATQTPRRPTKSAGRTPPPFLLQMVNVSPSRPNV